MGTLETKTIKEDVLIAELHLQGKTLRDIGKMVNRDKDTIARRLQKKQVRELIEYGSKREVMRIPAACDTLDRLLHSKDEAIQLKVAENTLKSGGISTPHAPIYIQQVQVNQQIQILQPHVQALLTDHFAQVIDGQVIEDKFDSDIKEIGE